MTSKNAGLVDRMKDLSPEKLKLLDRLIEEKRLGKQTITEAINKEPPRKDMRSETPVAASRYRQGKSDVQQYDWADPGPKEDMRAAYDAYHETCNTTVFGEHSWFMNLGYVPTENKQYSQISLPAHMPNRNSVNLAAEVIGDCDLSDCEILDVGCGRGGTIHLMQANFKLLKIVGVDLSPEGIAYCERVHSFPDVSFINGDAEDLPFNDSMFDVVTNIESSHCYPNRYDFYREVWRVLRSGGHFLYSDVLPVDMFRESMEFMEGLGFEVKRDLNITENVMTSCEQMADLQFEAFASMDGDEWMANAIGVPGSQIYKDMKNRITNFRITKLKKS